MLGDESDVAVVAWSCSPPEFGIALLSFSPMVTLHLSSHLAVMVASLSDLQP